MQGQGFKGRDTTSKLFVAEFPTLCHIQEEGTKTNKLKELDHHGERGGDPEALKDAQPMPKARPGRGERLHQCGRYCCATGCHNNQNRDGKRGIRFHVFPQEEERRKLWNKAVNRSQESKSSKLWTAGKYDVLCSAHFVGGVKSNDKKSPSYVPSIFPTHDVKGKSDDQVRREERRKRLEEARQSQPRRQGPVQRASQRVDSRQAEGEEGAPRERGEVGAGEDSEEEEDNKGGSGAEPEEEEEEISVVVEEEEIFAPSSQHRKIMLPYGNQVNMTGPQEEEESCENPLILMNFVDQISSTEKATQFTSHLPSLRAYKKNKEKKSSVESALQCSAGVLPFSTFSDRQVKAFCGVDERVVQFLLYKVGGSLQDSVKCTRQTKILLLFTKLKLAVSFTVLAASFCVSETTVKKMFREALTAVHTVAAENIVWFKRELIQSRMPPSFKALYPLTRAIIDCSEIPCERPPKVYQRVQMYSSYKGRHTVKFLVATAPSGEVTFVSKCYGGRATDTEITCKSGFLQLLEEGDQILADKGFPSIQNSVSEAGGILVMPPFKSGEKQFTQQENSDGYKCASVRIHVERSISRLKIFESLRYVPITMLPHIDKMLVVICFVTNVFPDLIKT